jgi:hypothetical protein
MRMILDGSSNPPNDEEMVELRRYVHVWRRRCLSATTAFLLSSALAYPFLAGHSLHEYWESIGKNLIRLSMALLVAWGWCTTVFFNAWLVLRNLEKRQE